MKPEETIDFHIKATWHSIFKMYNQIASEHGLSQASGFVLLYIDEENGTPSTTIAPLMGVRTTSLSRLLKSMEKKGLILRKPDSNDKRSIKIHLTDLGREKRKISKKVVKGFNDKLLNKLSPEERRMFFRTTEVINESIEEYLNEKTVRQNLKNGSSQNQK